MKRHLILIAGLLSCAGAQAAPEFCTLAGHYHGSYSGGQDHGIVEATIAGSDGRLSGVAKSASGRQLPIRGDVTSRGDISNATAGRGNAGAAGVAESGAVFTGGFFTVPGGGADGGGNWSLGADGGNWTVVRDAKAAGCL